MFNVPQIQARLKGMSQQQLFQEGQANQHDSLMFSLVNNENMNRQKAKQAIMAQQAGQQQPPVVQQDLAQMAPTPAPNMGSGIPLQGAGSPQQVAQNQLPEEQGIGALPAQNLQKMAGGGITGEPQHFLQGGVPYTRQTMLDIVNQTNAQLPKPIEEMSDAELNAFIGDNHPVTPVPVKRERYKEPDLPPAVNLFGQGINYVGSGMFNAGNALVNNANQRADIQNKIGSHIGDFFTMPQSQYNQKYVAPETAASSPGITSLLGQNQPTNAQATADLNFAKTKNVGDEVGDTANKAPWSPGIVAPQVSAAGVALGPKPTAAGAKNAANTFYDPSGIQNLLQENVTERGVLNTQNAVALDTMIKARPNLGGDYEKRLKDQEAKEPEKIENLKGMSMLEAGLAIMGGNSPYAMQNIARGVEGVKSYKEGLKDLEKARDLRDQAFAHIDDTRKALQIGDQNLAYTSQVQANDKFMDAKEHAASGYASALGVSGKMGADLFANDTNNYASNQRTNAQLAGTLAGVNAQLKMEAAKLNLPPEQIRSAMYLGNGDIEAGMNKIQELSRDKSGIGLLTALSTVNAKRASLMQPEITMDEFLSGLPKAMAAMQQPKVVSGANPNAVLARPGMQ